MLDTAQPCLFNNLTWQYLQTFCSSQISQVYKIGKGKHFLFVKIFTPESIKDHPYLDYWCRRSAHASAPTKWPLLMVLCHFLSSSSSLLTGVTFSLFSGIFTFLPEGWILVNWRFGIHTHFTYRNITSPIPKNVLNCATYKTVINIIYL